MLATMVGSGNAEINIILLMSIAQSLAGQIEIWLQWKYNWQNKYRNHIYWIFENNPNFNYSAPLANIEFNTCLISYSWNMIFITVTKTQLKQQENIEDGSETLAFN